MEEKEEGENEVLFCVFVVAVSCGEGGSCLKRQRRHVERTDPRSTVTPTSECRF